MGSDLTCFLITVEVNDTVGPIYTANVTTIASNEAGVSRAPQPLYSNRKSLPLKLCCDKNDVGLGAPAGGHPIPTNYWRLVVQNFDTSIGPEFRQVKEIYLSKDETILVQITP